MDAQITIIGAGVIGLAIAQKVSQHSSGVFLLEKHNTFGQETSSRNSEVIHAGIYYTKGSLKARLCVEGNRLLYDYCRRKDVPFKNCGKLIVATTPAEVTVIEGIKKTAEGNGVFLEICERDKVMELEPNITALRALYSPTTGIVDSHQLMKQYETDAVINGCQISYKSEVTGLRKIDGGYEVTISEENGNSYSFTSGIVINSAGLTSDKISAMTGIMDENLIIYFCKGEYFRINPPKNRLINRLVYPVPHHNMEGIGIHVTVDMGGGVKLGPDVKYLDKKEYDYTLTPSKRDAFYDSAVKFLPFLKREDIAPEMAGIRPKIQKKGEEQKDFYIMEESRRGLPGFINLVGMESPGLTSSLAIANYVNNLINNTI
ncbi:MAG TPA: NAD(P)/FAD-dependent oxidoreductase [Bacteroidales bacterium]|nr:NAD(P)/FAD-dependent oxidoreductase [Bacteroidales bacterium]